MKKNKQMTWKELKIRVNRLTQLVNKSNFKPNLVVGITRGGAVLSKVFSKINFCESDTCYIRNRRVFKDGLNNVSGEHTTILIVDDIIQDGVTIEICMDSLINKRKPRLNNRKIIRDYLLRIAEIIYYDPYGVLLNPQKDILKKINPTVNVDDIYRNITEEVDKIRTSHFAHVEYVTGKDGGMYLKIDRHYTEQIKQAVISLSDTLCSGIYPNSVVDHTTFRVLLRGGLLNYNCINEYLEDTQIKTLALLYSNSSSVDVDFSGGKDNLLPPWAKTPQKAIRNLEKEDIAWKQDVINEIKRQYLEVNNKELPKHLSTLASIHPFSSDDIKQIKKQKNKSIICKYIFEVEPSFDIKTFIRTCEYKEFNVHENVIAKDKNNHWINFNFIEKKNTDITTFELEVQNSNNVKSYPECNKECEIKLSNTTTCFVCSLFKRSLYYLKDIYDISRGRLGDNYFVKNLYFSGFDKSGKEIFRIKKERIEEFIFQIEQSIDRSIENYWE